MESGLTVASNVDLNKNPCAVLDVSHTHVLKQYSIEAHCMQGHNQKLISVGCMMHSCIPGGSRTSDDTFDKLYFILCRKT